MPDDSIRHKQDVARTMLSACGGRSKNDAELAKMIAATKKEKEKRAVVAWRTGLQSKIEETAEGKGSVWVHGRCGKLIPQALYKVDASTIALETQLQQIIAFHEGKGPLIKQQALIALEADASDTKILGANEYQAGQSLAPGTHWKVVRKFLPEDNTKHLQINLMNDDLRPLLESWLRSMYEMHKYISEDLPRGPVIRWAASEYCLQRDILMPEMCKCISLAKFLTSEMTFFSDAVNNPEAALMRSTGMAVKMLLGDIKSNHRGSVTANHRGSVTDHKHENDENPSNILQQSVYRRRSSVANPAAITKVSMKFGERDACPESEASRLHSWQSVSVQKTETQEPRMAAWESDAALSTSKHMYLSAAFVPGGTSNVTLAQANGTTDQRSLGSGSPQSSPQSRDHDAFELVAQLNMEPALFSVAGSPEACVRPATASFSTLPEAGIDGVFEMVP